MTGIDDLRAALREQPEDAYAPPDLPRILAEGRRLRRRRQLLQCGAVVAVVAVVALVLGLTAQLRGGSPQAPVAAQPTAAEREERPPLGRVVGTGLSDSVGEVVLYMVAIDVPELPEVHFGLMAGHRTPGGVLTADLLANETAGAALKPGFRVLDGGSEQEPRLPVFGYYVGPASRITTTVGARTVQARQALWSQDPSVVIFWFPPADVPSDTVLTPPRAYDATGAQLPR
ncbi:MULTISPECIES: hypothetical protein [Amycolatopsis]|uniref:Uncharacterized protein n=1 Tax=Amycolatopsis dongchuanensis TaxID=1070866 RepID=A0ABP9QJE1_9PSEU